MITQRALLTLDGRQFALNGYLALSQTQGKRLIVTENFGHVMADVLVKPDGRVYVMQASRLFPSKWIRRFLAPDLECVFGNLTDADCPVKMLDPNHYVLERRGYSLDLRIVGTTAGAQSAELFDETNAPRP